MKCNMTRELPSYHRFCLLPLLPLPARLFAGVPSKITVSPVDHKCHVGLSPGQLTALEPLGHYPQSLYQPPPPAAAGSSAEAAPQPPEASPPPPSAAPQPLEASPPASAAPDPP